MAKEKNEQILLDEEEINGTEAERVQIPIEPKVQKESNGKGEFPSHYIILY